MSIRRLLVRSIRLLTAKGRRLPDLSWITSSLGISGTVRPHHIEGLAQLGVGAIVDLRAEGRDDEALLAQSGIRFLHLPVPDHWPPSQAQLVTGTRWMLDQLRAGHKTLIHCKEGVGRSVILGCCVLMAQGYGLADALRLVGARRWGVALNQRQMDGLEQFARLAAPSTGPVPRGLPFQAPPPRYTP